MLSLSLPGRVFLCTLPTDMRKSFDSLAGLVEQQLGQIRLRAICSSFAAGAAIGSSSCIGTVMARRFGTNGSKKARSCFRRPMTRAKKLARMAS